MQRASRGTARPASPAGAPASVGSLVGVCDRSAEEQELQRVARFPRAPPGRRGSKALILSQEAISVLMVLLQINTNDEIE